MQSFKMQKMSRSDINLANYNPRIISKEAQKRLEKGLNKFGLVQPLIFNSRTKTLVSGHQRLAVLDKMAKGKEYELDVAVIDVSEKDEMALNVQLNNTSMMGEFDIDALNNMVTFGADVLDMGFSETDIEIMFHDNALIEKFKDSEEAAKSKNILGDIKKERSEMSAEKQAENSASFYFVVVCESEDQRTELYKQMAVPLSEEFIPATHLARLNLSRTT